MKEADLIEMIDEALENERIWRRLVGTLAKLDSIHAAHLETASELVSTYRQLVTLLRRWEHGSLHVGEKYGGEVCG